jgi:hypothetical protein
MNNKAILICLLTTHSIMATRDGWLSQPFDVLRRGGTWEVVQ